MRRFVASRPDLKTRLGGAWDAIDRVQQAARQLSVPLTMVGRGRGFDSHYFQYARMLVRGADERSKPNGERLPEFTDANTPELEQTLFSTAPVYPDFEKKVTLGLSLTKMRESMGADDAFVKQVLGKQAPDQFAAALIDGTKLGDPAVRKALWTGGKDAIASSNDPFIKLALAIDPHARAIRKQFEQDVEAVEQKNSELIAQARFAQQGLDAYPDATFTLRMSYGEVKGWDDAGKKIAPFTTIGGAFERDTGAEPFALPASWHKAKDRLNLAQPFNFVTTNDIIGGNSGSPMINRNGEIVGLIFDGNIHSLGGAFWYDGRINRTVAVHSGAITEMLGKIYGGENLVREMTAH
ncbi:S46 family peptidase [Undibacterium arcticum]